jgi:lipopolysaccharide export system protein LptC
MGLQAAAGADNEGKVNELYDDIRQEQEKNSKLRTQINQIRETSRAEVAPELQRIKSDARYATLKQECADKSAKQAAAGASAKVEKG